MDPRKRYLISCIRSFLNLPEDPKGLSEKTVIEQFLNNAEQQSMALAYIPAKKGFKYYKFTESIAPNTQIILLIKNQNHSFITEENIQSAVSVIMMPCDHNRNLQNFCHSFLEPVRNLLPNESVYCID